MGFRPQDPDGELWAKTLRILPPEMAKTVRWRPIRWQKGVTWGPSGFWAQPAHPFGRRALGPRGSKPRLSLLFSRVGAKAHAKNPSQASQSQNGEAASSEIGAQEFCTRSARSAGNGIRTCDSDPAFHAPGSQDDVSFTSNVPLTMTSREYPPPLLAFQGLNGSHVLKRI